MNLEHFGRLVKTLRKQGYNQEGNRLTRENLSKLVYLTEDQLGRLERGDRKHLDKKTLSLLADAFKLNNEERKEFFYAAFGSNEQYLYKNEDPVAQLNELLVLLQKLQAPAYIHDVYTDVLAANHAALWVCQVTPDQLEHARNTPAGFNLMHYIYAPVMKLNTTLGSHWKEISEMAMFEFRRLTLRYRHTDYFRKLFETLSKSEQFSIEWYKSLGKDNHTGSGCRHLIYNHLSAGPLSYTETRTVLNTNAGELYLKIFNPVDAITARTFENLLNKENKVQTLADWPEKHSAGKNSSPRPRD